MPEEPRHWTLVKRVLDLALDASPLERPQIVKDACGGNAVLERDVDSMLVYASQTGKLDLCLHETVRDLDWSAQAPSRIGAYRVDRLLGSGGMATVYLGVRDDGELPPRVALKVIQAWSSEGLLERFRDERRILGGLIHPYIARLLDAGELDDGRPYFVMEYVDGVTIDEHAASHPSAVLELFLKVCSAVQFAHQNLVIHRDIKPGNILVTADGDPRLLDFGIAKLLAGDDRSATGRRTQPWERMLTPISASPEQAAGEPVTIASDVYSLGVLLYRLLTGVSPYAASKDAATDPIRVIREYEPPLASTAGNLTKRERAQLRGDLDNILQRALQKDPARRYSTVQDFAADIRRHLTGLPIEARPVSFSYRALKFIRRNRLAVTAAAVVLLAIAGALVGISRYAREAHVEQVRAQRELAALRKVTESFLFEFDDAIRNLPGSSAAQELVVRRAVEYVDKMAAEAGDDPLLLNDLAGAYGHIADITGAFRGTRGATSPGRALENGLKALALRRRLLALNPGNEKAWTNLEDSLWATGGRYDGVGDFQHAGELYQEHLRMCEQSVQRADSADQRYRLAASFTSNGSIERELGHYDAALRYQRRGLAVREALLKADPASKRARRTVGISHEFIGYAYSSQRNYLSAADEHRQALDIFEPIAGADPHNTGMQRLTGVARENLCESLALGGEAKQALSHCGAAVSIYRAIATANSKDIQALEDLASGESTMSVALDLSHSPQAALEHQLKARQLFASTMSVDPDGRDLAQANAWSLMELAKLRKQLHLAGAADAAAEAVGQMQRLAARSPQSREIGTALERAEDLYRSMH